ncbi:MAG: biotin/lipoyl-containing protein [Bacteroidia bacterium]
MKVIQTNSEITLSKSNGLWLKNIDKDIEIIQKDQETLIVITENKVYTLYCTYIDKENKTIAFLKNGENIKIELREPLDEILKSMGLEDAMTPKVSDVKAPMPGLVLEVHVKPGDPVKKGDTIVVLEAMKMENSIKSPVEAIVQSVSVEKGQAVDKNAVLVNFN